MKNKFIPILIFSSIVLSACTDTPAENTNQEQKLEKVKVQAGWLLNGEFANVCSSITEGYYKDEGLDVELIPGGPSGASFILATSVVAQDDSITLGIDGDMIPLIRGITKENESEKLRVKAFAAFWNDNPYGFIVKKDSGLNSLKDFIKTKSDGSKYKIGVTADSVAQEAIAKASNVPVSALNLITIGYDATPFLSGEVDALASYWTTQAYEVEKAGIDYKFLPASELAAFNQPSMVAIASDKTIKEKKGTLVKWLKATVKGSQFVINNPEKAAKNILDERCGGSKFNASQEEWLIKKSIPLFDKSQIGNLNETQIQDFAKAYFELGQIPYAPKNSEFIDTSILKGL